MAKNICVTILNNQQGILDGFLCRLGHISEIDVLPTLAFGEELAPASSRNSTDIVLLDFSVPTGPENPNVYPTLTKIPKMLQPLPDLDIVVISKSADHCLVLAVMKAGDSGYVFKDGPDPSFSSPATKRLDTTRFQN